MQNIHVKEITKRYIDYVIEKRRYFHMNPEASEKEFNTSKIIQEELRTLGISFDVVRTSVIARIIGGKPGKTVLLRADMDALEVCEENEVSYRSRIEGMMHACGHDGHTAMLLGVAHVLKEIEDQIEGTVVFFFQHAEESATGAKIVLEEYDLLKDVDSVFAIHLWQGIPVGKISLEAGPRMAASDTFKIEIHGKSGHGSMPHETVDTIVVSSALIMNLQSLVSRNTNPTDTLVVTIGKFIAGTRFNVIAGKAILEGTARSFSDSIWKGIPEKLERMIQNTCIAYGATAVLDLKRATPPLVNDERISAILKESAMKLYGPDVLTLYEKSPGGEDFAYLTQKLPGAMAFVGIRNDEKGINAPHHNERFDMDERALEIGTNLYIQFALDFLSKK